MQNPYRVGFVLLVSCSWRSLGKSGTFLIPEFLTILLGTAVVGRGIFASLRCLPLYFIFLVLVLSLLHPLLPMLFCLDLEHCCCLRPGKYSSSPSWIKSGDGHLPSQWPSSEMICIIKADLKLLTCRSLWTSCTWEAHKSPNGNKFVVIIVVFMWLQTLIYFMDSWAVQFKFKSSLILKVFKCLNRDYYF